MSERTLEYGVEGGVGWIHLNRPQVLNAINDDACHALIDAVDALEAQSAVGVVVLSGGDCRAFSAGADVTHMRGLSSGALRQFIELTWRAFDRLATSRLLSLASMNGYALGGGAELALACDLRIADETIKLGFPEMALGSVPGSGGVQRLPALIGKARALEMFVSGRHVGGKEAEAIGLINLCVPAGQALSTALEWAGKFSSRPPASIRYLKTAISLPPDSAGSPLLHGLISDVCQSQSGYRAKTQAFAGV
jgi:enoyl-CoA hydratase/carnithine racemase